MEQIDGQVYITEEDYDALKTLYDDSIASGEEVFEYKGHQVYTGYIKYVFEYIDNARNKNVPR